MQTNKAPSTKKGWNAYMEKTYLVGKQIIYFTKSVGLWSNPSLAILIWSLTTKINDKKGLEVI